jgi:hypothetical protein
MCLVIDTCCLAFVFDGRNKKHASFAPVLKWINGEGYMIYGGTKYNDELRRAPKYLSYVAELSRRRRTIRIASETVDPIAAELKRKMPEPEFDDEHLVALVIAARCCVVCTIDDVAISYLKRTEIFRAAGLVRPKIYKGGKKHHELCCRSHLAAICRAQQ